MQKISILNLKAILPEVKNQWLGKSPVLFPIIIIIEHNAQHMQPLL